jgi:hypothetical protein
MVVLELGLGDGGRAAVVARSVTLGWADGAGAYSPQSLMETLEIPTSAALRVALSRARRRLAEDRSFAAAVDRSADLAGVPRVVRRGSDPWRHGQRAARAAS